MIRPSIVEVFHGMDIDLQGTLVMLIVQWVGIHYRTIDEYFGQVCHGILSQAPSKSVTF